MRAAYTVPWGGPSLPHLSHLPDSFPALFPAAVCHHCSGCLLFQQSAFPGMCRRAEFPTQSPMPVAGTGPIPAQGGRGPTGSEAAWGGLTHGGSRRAGSWQNRCQPIWCRLNLIICRLPSGCCRTMYSARTRTWVRDRDSLGLLHSPLDTVTRASGSDTAL